MSEIDKHEALVHKLSYHEKIIGNILSLPCNNLPIKLAAIERKIVALEELVLELPYGNEKTVFEEWRDLISDLYRRYFQLASEKKKKPEKAVSSEKMAKESSTEKGAVASDKIETGNDPSATNGAVTSTGTGVNKSNKKRSQSTASGGQNNDRALQAFRRPGPVKQTYRNLNFRRSSSVLPSAEPVIEKSVEEQKEELKAQYDGFFSKLEPVAELTVDSDLEAMRILSLLVNRCIRQMSPFEDDVGLLSDVLSYALPKAPKSVIDRYNSLKEEAEKKELENKETENEEESKRPPLKGLRLLKKCLIAELTSYYEASKAALVSEEGDCGEVAEGQSCFYCKSNGHYKFRCPQVKNQICFRCFKRGHKAKECGRRCYKCGLMGHYKKFCKV